MDIIQFYKICLRQPKIFNLRIHRQPLFLCTHYEREVEANIKNFSIIFLDMLISKLFILFTKYFKMSTNCKVAGYFAVIFGFVYYYWCENGKT
jgi:hypothetical protein